MCTCPHILRESKLKIKYDLRFSRRWLWRWLSFVLYRRVDWCEFTKVSEVLNASIIRAWWWTVQKAAIFKLKIRLSYGRDAISWSIESAAPSAVRLETAFADSHVFAMRNASFSACEWITCRRTHWHVPWPRHACDCTLRRLGLKWLADNSSASLRPKRGSLRHMQAGQRIITPRR
jgi:hypothetical protein